MLAALTIAAANGGQSEVGGGLSTGAGIAIILGSLVLVAIAIGVVWRLITARAARRPVRDPQEPGHAGRVGS